MIRLPEIKTAELSTYGNFAMCHQALFRIPREGLGTRLSLAMVLRAGIVPGIIQERAPRHVDVLHIGIDII